MYGARVVSTYKHSCIVDTFDRREMIRTKTRGVSVGFQITYYQSYLYLLNESPCNVSSVVSCPGGPEL
jgi:hypothetical protein